MHLPRRLRYSDAAPPRRPWRAPPSLNGEPAPPSLAVSDPPRPRLATAAAIAAGVGPSQPSLVSPEITDWYDAAVERSSAANPSQAAAAASIGAEPGPEYIRMELISGGNAPKSIAASPNRPRPRWQP